MTERQACITMGIILAVVLCFSYWQSVQRFMLAIAIASVVLAVSITVHRIRSTRRRHWPHRLIQGGK